MKRRSIRGRLVHPIGAIILVASVLAVGAAPAGASVFTVTRFDDPTPGSCQVNDCSLREAVEASNVNPVSVDTIELAAGTYVLAGSFAEDANQTGDLDISGHVTISGAGQSVTVIDLAGLGDRAFDLTGSSNVVLEDFAIINGNVQGGLVSGGGAVLHDGDDLRLDNMRFENNGTTAGGLIGWSGGAVRALGAMTVVDSVFIENRLALSDGPTYPSSGGAIAAEDSLEVLRSSFVANFAGEARHDANSGGDGGAIAASGPTSIHESSFVSNRAGPVGKGGNGGAIAFNGVGATAAVITDSVLIDNSSGWTAPLAQTVGTDSGDGGAISSINVDLTISGSTFTGNYTADGGNGIGSAAGGNAGAGGAIFFKADSANLYISDSTFESNYTGNGGKGHPAGAGGDGGAVWFARDEFSGVDGYIVTSTFNENKTGDGGQGVYYFSVDGNTPGEGGPGGDGGAIWGIGGVVGFPSLPSFNVRASTVAGNTAGAGGRGANGSNAATMTSGGDGGPGGNGGAVDGQILTITQSTIAGNTAGDPGPGGSAGLFGTPGSPGVGGKAGGLAASQVFLGSSVIATNSASVAGFDCFAELATPVYSLNYNLIGIDSDCAIVDLGSPTPNDQIGTAASPIDPLLNPLGYNGGTTLTMHPKSGSPLIDAIPGFSCTDDQRGVARPVGPACDIGAVEVTDLALTALPTPCPLYDSSSATGTGLAGSFAGNETRTVQVTGAVPVGQGVGTTQCVPAEATAVVYTVSAINPQGVGNLRLSASGVVPNGGVVNYVPNGLNNANTVTVPLGLTGQADVKANAGATDVRLVAIGYYSVNGTLSYNPLTPCAIADSRTTGTDPASGPYAGPFASGSAYPDLDVVGVVPNAQGGNPAGTNCGVPATADAVVVNLVAIRPPGVTGFGGQGFLSAATGTTDPFEPATPFADLSLNNAATTIIPLTITGEISVDVDGLSGTVNSHIRVVVLGYLDDATGDSYQPVNPCAAFDSRTGQGATGSFLGQREAGSATTYVVTGIVPTAQGGNGGDCGVPSGATAVLINLVAIQPGAAGNFRAYATGSTPTGGVLNFAPLGPPMNNSNAIVVPISAIGQMDLFVNAPPNAGSPTVDARGIILGYYS